MGSTCQPLYKRSNEHERSTSEEKCSGSPIYKAVKELGTDSFYIELLETYPCNDRNELTAREGHWIGEMQTYKDGYNKVVNGRTYKDYKEDNKETISKAKEERI